MIGEVSFLQQLQTYNPSRMSPETMRQLRPYVGDQDFTPQNFMKQSMVAGAFCEWILAVFCQASNANRV